MAALVAMAPIQGVMVQNGLSALEVPIPTPGGTTAGSDWNFAGSSGSLNSVESDTGWVDFAFPVWEGLDEDDISIEVEALLDKPAAQDRTQVWLCGHMSLRFEGSASQGASKVMICQYELDDGVIEVTAEMQGQRLVDLEVVEPPCQLVECNGSTRTWSISTETFEEFSLFESFLAHEDSPVAHFTVFAGTVGPKEVRIQAEWTNTTVTWTNGPREDVMTVFSDEFSSDLYVRADVLGLQPYQQDNASLEIELLDADQTDRTALFLYRPPLYSAVAWPGEADGGYVRPDGTECCTIPRAWEATSMPGTWRFWYTYSQWYWADDPVIVGTVFDWAEEPTAN